VPATQIGGAGTVNIVVISGGVSSTAFSFPVNPPPPVVTSLNPASAVATGAAFTLTVNGSGFGQNATVQWNGTALPSTFVGANQLTAYVTASLIATAGSASVIVSSGGASTTAVTFPVNAPPAITTLSPASAVGGSGQFTLTVNGTGFVSGAQVQWNGATLPTTFVSATQLTANVSGGLIASIGSVTIQVNYSGASSIGTTFPINGPPAITGLSPASAAAGGAAFTLTVNGTGFLSGNTVTWNSTALTTKFVSATQLTASVSAGLIASAGAATITVTAGGVSSSPLTLPINPPPAIAALSPGTVVGTGAAFTLTVSGTGFLAGAIVQWNGTPLATTFVNSGELTAAVPANLAVGALTASIVALNPGGAPSAAARLSITVAQPAVAQGGVVPLYSSTSVIQPGSWISIYGTGLGNGTYTWTGNYPTSLGGTTVKIDNKPAYLWMVSPTQINLQAPDDTATGTVNVVVTTPNGSTTSTVTLAPYGPSFSLLPASNYAAAVILTPDGSGAYGGGAYDLAGPVGQFTFSTRPAKPGETVEFYGVGFGPTSPSVLAGKAFTGSAPTTNPVTITIGGTNARVLFAGITASGVYQFNVVVPSVGSGDQTMVATVGGVASPPNVLVTVQ
jgi:trimeric autotransporter adhesin